MFFTPGVGAKDTNALGPVVTGIMPQNLTIYGRPYQWLPVTLSSGMSLDALADFYTPSSDPCLWIGQAMCDAIKPYVDIMNRSLAVLNQNIFAMSQPVLISGLPTANLNGLLLESEIMDGESFIQIVGREAVQPEVLDLKVQDRTQNLISTIDWCDARILEIMMSSNGVEKASGITTLETVSGVQSIIQQYDNGLELRKEWAEQVNDALGLSLRPSPGKGIESLMNPSQTAQGAMTDDKEGEDDAEVS